MINKEVKYSDNVIMLPRMVSKLINDYRVMRIEEEINMDWQDRYFQKLDNDISEIKNSLVTTENRISKNIDKALNEIRERDNQLNQDFKTLKADLRGTRNWIIGIAISLILGIAGLVYANLQFVTSLINLIQK